ncbi:MAG TPA: P1 family peptidase [Smithellaceae bacterium]|nr:P1 family peptidase [Smithellaceae bacterium]
MKAGQKNSLTDVAGILVGHYSDIKAACGTSVALFPEGATGGVDVRGSAPGTRETDLLAPHNLVERVQAIVLSGGSVYGLTAADGVVRWLAQKGWGFPLQDKYVAPIVPAAALFDLGRGENFIPPVSATWGEEACKDASNAPVKCGNTGAGTGAMAGGIKGGLGSASEVLESGITVAAMVAVNSLGAVIDPATGSPWELRMQIAGEFGEIAQKKVQLPATAIAQACRNTTIGIVATDAMLNKAQAQKIAQMAHDGYARSIRPAHTMFDGDTIFCAATNKKPLPSTPGFFASPTAPAINEIGSAAADCMARAIIRAVLSAETLHNMISFSDLKEYNVK